jgi:hypothetical protein
VSIFYAEAVGSQGKDVWTFVPTAVAPDAMTVAEITATGACDLQNSFRPGFGVSAETERVADERQGALVTYQALGQTTLSFSDMVVIDRPQDADAAATKKHLTVLSTGAKGFLVNRRGLGSAVENWVAWASTQKYLAYPVEVGYATPLAPGDSKSFEKSISFAITGASVEGTVAA